ncbi:MAG: beta-hydroxyacyl-ACP dehydratase [Phycisphaerae bacterium]|nr:beta-hydroxyacyl-ACP dehydratase [Phycisphaerae bacterium]
MNPRSAIDSIPHRPPFLFVDEVVELTADRVVTKVVADPDADYFKGHYPGNPLMPGVLICECALQAGAILMMHRIDAGDDKNSLPVLTRINEAKFKHMVKPNQTLRVEVVFNDELSGAYYMTGRVTVDGRMVLRVTFVCMLADKSSQEDRG